MTIKEIRLLNLLSLIERVGGNKQFAEKTGMDVGYVSHIRTGFRGIGNAVARKIEHGFDLTDGWMDTPNWTLVDQTKYIGTKQSEKLMQMLKEPTSQVYGSNKASVLPVISWVQAGQWTEIQDEFVAGDADEWLPCPIKHGPNAYILRVKGVSMENPGGRPSFSEGDLIFVDPDRSPEHRSLVVVRLEADSEATFKQLLIEGGKRYLRALNPAWPTPVVEINGNATLCGVVIFKGEKL